MKNKYHYVVYNTCFGGFSLSKEAIKMCQDFGLKIDEYTDGRKICRHDPKLVRIVKKLKDKANGDHARLSIKKLKSNKYRINDYDGSEAVIEPGYPENWIVIDE